MNTENVDQDVVNYQLAEPVPREYIVEYRLNKKSGFNRLICRDRMKWRTHSKYEKFSDMEKAVKDLNKNHKGLYQFRMKPNQKRTSKEIRRKNGTTNS